MANSPTFATFEATTQAGLLAEFEALVGEVIRLRTLGCTGVELVRAQGAADGFAQALTAAGLVSDRDLLLAAQSARRGGSSALVRILETSDSSAELLEERRSVTRARSGPAKRARASVA
jgi:hypothetical protein